MAMLNNQRVYLQSIPDIEDLKGWSKWPEPTGLAEPLTMARPVVILSAPISGDMAWDGTNPIAC